MDLRRGWDESDAEVVERVALWDSACSRISWATVPSEQAACGTTAIEVVFSP